MTNFNRIIISRTDSIGDVILTLPLAGMLKKKFPGSRFIFLGRAYTRDVIRCCGHIDEFLDWDELSGKPPAEAIEHMQSLRADLIIHVFPRKEIARMAKKAGIPLRLGTTNRLYHWGNSNKLVRLSRRKSDLHEAQLNLRLAAGITGEKHIPLQDIPSLYGFRPAEPLEEKFRKFIDDDRRALILHPKSKGSAREWGLERFKALAEMLPPEKYRVFISGTSEEEALMKDSGILDMENVTNLCGQMSLSQFISFIASSYGLVAASTGPLHLAAALGIRAIGIYPPIRPMHPGRWAPLGEKTAWLVKDKPCSDCRVAGPCLCMEEIRPEAVKKLIEHEEVKINP